MNVSIEVCGRNDQNADPIMVGCGDYHLLVDTDDGRVKIDGL